MHPQPIGDVWQPRIENFIKAAYFRMGVQGLPQQAGPGPGGAEDDELPIAGFRYVHGLVRTPCWSRGLLTISAADELVTVLTANGRGRAGIQETSCCLAVVSYLDGIRP